MIRDIAIIVFTVVSLVVVVIVGTLMIRLYKTVHRAAENAEAVTGSIRSFISAPLNPIQTLTELGNNVMGWIREYRSKQRRDEEDEE